MAVNLCTVGTLSSTSANTNAIVEENGALKRVKLNKVNELDKTNDTNGAVQISGLDAESYYSIYNGILYCSLASLGHLSIVKNEYTKVCNIPVTIKRKTRIMAQALSSDQSCNVSGYIQTNGDVYLWASTSVVCSYWACAFSVPIVLN